MVSSGFDWDRFEFLMANNWGGADSFARLLGYDAGAPGLWRKRLHEPRKALLLSRLRGSGRSPNQQSAFEALWSDEPTDPEALSSLTGDLRDVSPGGEPQALFRAEARQLSAQVSLLVAFPQEAEQRLQVALTDLHSYLGPFRRSLAAWTYAGVCDLHECAVLAERGLPDEVTQLQGAWSRLRRKGEEAARSFASPLKQAWMRSEAELEVERLANSLDRAAAEAQQRRQEFLPRLERELQAPETYGFAAGERGEVTAMEFLEAHAHELTELRSRAAAARTAWTEAFSAPEEELEAGAIFSPDQLKEFEALLCPWQQRELLQILLLPAAPHKKGPA